MGSLGGVEEMWEPSESDSDSMGAVDSDPTGEWMGRERERERKRRRDSSKFTIGLKIAWRVFAFSRQIEQRFCSAKK